MLSVMGEFGKDLCDQQLGMSRRRLLRVGSSGILGVTLGSMLQMKARAEDAGISGGPGWGRAKSVVLVYLQGGPSHLDLWDPKPEAPDNVKSIFQPIETKVPGVHFTEILPNLAKINDKLTMIRSIGYTPNGLFNHTDAMCPKTAQSFFNDLKITYFRNSRCKCGLTNGNRSAKPEDVHKIARDRSRR